MAGAGQVAGDRQPVLGQAVVGEGSVISSMRTRCRKTSTAAQVQILMTRSAISVPDGARGDCRAERVRTSAVLAETIPGGHAGIRAGLPLTLPYPRID